MTLLITSIAQDVHYERKLLENQKVILVVIENIENTVSKKRILVLAQDTHDVPKLNSIHGSHTLNSFCD